MTVFSKAVWNGGDYDRYIFFSFDKKKTFVNIVLYSCFYLDLDRHPSFEGANIIAIVNKKLGLINAETSQS